MKSVLTYTLKSCTKCLKCIKVCPTGAITLIDDRVNIAHDKCINCSKCAIACHNKGIQSKGSTLEDIKNYDYTICMVPSSLISDCKSIDEVESLFYSIKMLGFDEVVDISDVEGQVLNEAHLYADMNDEQANILSFCPVINRLISINYPMLENNIIPINYSSEVAAKMLREKYKVKGKVGIFNCCECEAKLALAKYPYLNEEFEVDHALSIVDIFPLIKANFNKGKIKVDLCKEGLQSCNPSMMMVDKDVLVSDGFDKAINILEHAEFGLLNEFKLIGLFPCFNGCIGGHLLWGNSYLSKNNLYSLIKNENKEISKLPFEMLYKEDLMDKSVDKRSIEDKLELFFKISKKLDKLPGYDCTACGLPTCRVMAEEIVRGNKKLSDCKILKSMEIENVG